MGEYTVRYDGNRETNIFPNPATSEVTITTTASTSVQVMDVYGRVLTKQDISEGQNTINLSAFPSGVYHVGINNQRIKLIKSYLFQRGQYLCVRRPEIFST